MEYSLVRKGKKTCLPLTVLKMEGNEGGRPDGMSGKILMMPKC